MKTGIKDFSDIEIGDVVHRDGYPTLIFMVVKKGTAKELVKFDFAGGIKEGLDDGYVEDEDECVLVKSFEDGKKYVFVYGDGGVVGEWEMGNVQNCCSLN